MNTAIRNYIQHLLNNLLSAVKWIVFGLLTGLVVGAIASVFAKLILLATALRLSHRWIIFLMPVAGIVIVWCYTRAGSKGVGGTNMILRSIRNEERVPGRIAPLIFLSTVLTHLTGGSAGREGAALQMGGSVASTISRISVISRLFHFTAKDRRRIIMCGMSAAFSALFGTPLAATIMPIEVSTVGIMYYAALVPCAVSSLTAHFVANAFGLSGEIMPLEEIAAFSVKWAILFALFAALCAGVGVLFCSTMHHTEHLLKRYVKNDYVKAISGAVLIILLTLLIGDHTYNGAGSDIIELCITRPGYRVVWYAFLMKMIFTIITLSAEYKGGEIVPSLFIGATFGNLFGSLTHIDASLTAAVGMGCVFCAVTNCPVTSLVICFEMFGFEAMPYFLVSIAIAYLFSGNYGLYTGQKILHSKYEPGEIDASVH